MANKTILATAPTGPLAGIRILDLTSVVLGSYATQILGDQGADVIKLEDPGPGRADVLRGVGIVPEGAPRDLGPVFMAINRNKRSVAADLKAPASRPLIEALIRSCDVFATSVRYEGLKRLGLGYEDVRALRADVVYVQAVGYGSDGPYAGEPAYDDLIQAASGIADLPSRTDGNPAPRFLPTFLADKVSGICMSQAITAGLLHRERTGQGQFIEVPMLECITSFTLVEHMFNQTFDPPTGAWAYSRVVDPHSRPYRTADGYIGMLPSTNQQWSQFFTAGGAAETAGKDPRFADAASRSKNRAALAAAVEEVTQTKTSRQWLDLLKPLSIPVTVARRLEDLPQDPHLQAVDFFQTFDHPEAGAYRLTKPPVNFTGSPSNIRRHAPRLGEQTAEVLAELGLPPQ